MALVTCWVTIFLWFQELYLAFVNNVEYRQEFNTDEELDVFKEFIRSKDGILNKSITVNKKSLKSSWIPLNYFLLDIRKKIMKLVRTFQMLEICFISCVWFQLMRPSIERVCKNYGSVRLRKKQKGKVNTISQTDTDPLYDDTEASESNGKK